jgi:hypothetical protein
MRSSAGRARRVTGAVTDADTTCGNGVAWSVEHGDTLLAGGNLIDDEVELDDPNLDGIAVEEDDMLYLVITAAGEHSCDSTTVDFKVIEQL